MRFPKLAATIDEWDEDDEDIQKKCYKEAYEAFITYLYLENTDRSKYGSLLSGMHTQFSLGHDQYPQELSNAYNILGNHKWDATYQEQKL